MLMIREGVMGDRKGGLPEVGDWSASCAFG
jgi:hypothetical protein